MDEEEPAGDDFLDGLPDGSLLVAYIQIARVLTVEDQDLVVYQARDGAGDELGLTEVLGMLRLSEDTAIRDQMGRG